MSAAAKPATLRLDRLLANLGYGSRREVSNLAAAGAVTLDGVPLTDADGRIALSPDLPERLAVSGTPIDPVPGRLVACLNKPLGFVCSHKEDGRLIYELLPPRWRRRDPALSSVGRLDKDTTGLLLLTDDGGLLHRIISPKRHVPKVYRAALARPLGGHEAALFAGGTLVLEGDDAPLRPAILDVLAPTVARLTVTEGRYHQVRRMFAATGNHVTALHRERVGDLSLPDDLPPGGWRLLDAAGIAAIVS